MITANQIDAAVELVFEFDDSHYSDDMFDLFKDDTGADEDAFGSAEYFEWARPRVRKDVLGVITTIKNVATFQNGGILLARVINAPADWVKSGSYKTQPLGIYWSFRHSSAQAHWERRHDTSHVLWTIFGLVKLTDIDWPTTLQHNLIYWGEDEIRVRNKAPISVQNITIGGADKQADGFVPMEISA